MRRAPISYKAVGVATVRPRVLLVRGAFVVLLIVSVAWAAVIDVVLGSSLATYRGILLALTPVFVIAVVALRVAIQSRVVLCVSVATAMMCIYIVFVPWNDRKRFVDCLSKVRVDMRVDDVEGVMAGYIKGVGSEWYADSGRWGDVGGAEGGRATILDERSCANCTIVYRWSATDSHNADWGMVVFENGKVVNVEFLPD